MGGPDRLTQREGEVLRLVAAGRSSREIGADLVQLRVNTVKTPRGQISTSRRARMDVRS